MPLQLPNLDDRSYDDLMAEALAHIPTYSPEWTNHNPSDPGITLIELFAYLTDLLLYRSNRITDDNTRKFLKLLNAPDWQTGDLREQIRLAVQGIRERYRAVTADDYEFLAATSFNQWLIQNSQSTTNLVARAHCVPQRNLEAGTEADRLKLRPEHVSVVILPAGEKPNPSPPPQTVPSPIGSPNPQPSPDQVASLLSYLDERRMLTTKLHITGPYYAHVSAQLVIALNSDAVASDVINAVNASFANLLNPLPSASGEGWPFGHDVFVSALYQALEAIPGIDFITDIGLSSNCSPSDNWCVVADPIWHEEGDLVGLSIQDHHLPVFDKADIVVAPNSAFVTVNLTVSAKAAPNADIASLKRSIKTTLRNIFHPALGGPGPTSANPTNIFVSDLEVAIKQINGVLDPVVVAVDCVPSEIRQNDKDRGLFIHVPAGDVVDWRVTVQLS